MLLTHRYGPVLTLTLDRPEARNALSADLVEALTVPSPRGSDRRRYRGRRARRIRNVFSAGADLAALQALRTATYADNLADSERLGRLFEAILRHPKPVVARVHGHAIAGGCGLAAACDFAIAAERAKLGFSEVRIGFVPALVATFVTRTDGETAARELFLRGHLVRQPRPPASASSRAPCPTTDSTPRSPRCATSSRPRRARGRRAHQGAARRPARHVARRRPRHAAPSTRPRGRPTTAAPASTRSWARPTRRGARPPADATGVI